MCSCDEDADECRLSFRNGDYLDRRSDFYRLRLSL